MSKHIEFKKNDVIHWQKENGNFIKARVMCGGFGRRMKFQPWIHYELRGISEGLVTVSSPRLIRESKFFIDGYQGKASYE